MASPFNPSFIILRDGFSGIAEKITEEDLITLGLDEKCIEKPETKLAMPADCSSIPEEQERIFLCGLASSSFDVAWQLERENRLKAWDTVLCTTQSQGRGQLRRNWYSPLGNIYAALKLPATLRGDAASIVVGYLVVKALQKSLEALENKFKNEKAPKKTDAWSERIKFKWPNDILLDGYKIAGILLEEKGETLIAGIGINIFWAPKAELLRENYATPAGCICDLGAFLPINAAKSKLNVLNRNLEVGDNLSPLSLWLSLVSLMRFWYETNVLVNSAENIMQIIEKELAWRGRAVGICEDFHLLTTLQEVSSCILPTAGPSTLAGNTAGNTKAAAPTKTAFLLGLGPNGALRLDFDGKTELLVSGSIYLL